MLKDGTVKIQIPQVETKVRSSMSYAVNLNSEIIISAQASIKLPIGSLDLDVHNRQLISISKFRKLMIFFNWDW